MATIKDSLAGVQAAGTEDTKHNQRVQRAAAHASTWNTEEVAGFQRSEASEELKVPSSDRHTFPSAYLHSHMRLALIQLHVHPLRSHSWTCCCCCHSLDDDLHLYDDCKQEQRAGPTLLAWWMTSKKAVG